MKEMEDCENKWKDIHVHELKELNSKILELILKLSILLKAIYRLIQALSKFQWNFCKEIEKNFFECLNL